MRTLSDAGVLHGATIIKIFMDYTFLFELSKPTVINTLYFRNIYVWKRYLHLSDFFK